MNKIILTAKHGRPSTKNVFKRMKSPSKLVQRRQLNSKTYYRVYDQNNRNGISLENKARDYNKEHSITAENNILLRWGTREIINCNNKTIVYNKSEAIACATDKALSREMFFNAGISIPMPATPDNWEELNKPIIARPHTHSKGKNLYTFTNKNDFINHYNTELYYYSEFIDKQEEFRVHVGHSKVICLMEKTKPKNAGIAWNRAQTDTEPFENVRWNEADERGLHPVMIAGIEAVNALGLDCGATDVMVKDGIPYVLEVNTAPTLNSADYTSERWAKYFDWLFRVNTRRDHWDYSEFKKAKSLFWKNQQLNEN